MDDCVFCKIAKGAVPASVVYCDEEIMAFLDIRPVNLGHVLVIPRVHAKGLSELDSEVGGKMFKVAMIIAEGIRRSGIKCEGVNFFLADGEVAFQEVFHVHLHVIPRFTGDGFEVKFGPSYSVTHERKELDTTAEQIRRAMRKMISQLKP